MVQKNCLVDKCQSHKSDDLRQKQCFRVPMDSSHIKNKWFRAMKVLWRPEYDKIPYCCASHFKDEDFEPRADGMKKYKLKEGAIPTVFPWKTYVDAKVTTYVESGKYSLRLNKKRFDRDDKVIRQTENSTKNPVDILNSEVQKQNHDKIEELEKAKKNLKPKDVKGQKTINQQIKVLKSKKLNTDYCKCNICDAFCISIETLKKHIETQHGGKDLVMVPIETPTDGQGGQANPGDQEEIKTLLVTNSEDLQVHGFETMKPKPVIRPEPEVVKVVPKIAVIVMRKAKRDQVPLLEFEPMKKRRIVLDGNDIVDVNEEPSSPFKQEVIDLEVPINVPSPTRIQKDTCNFCDQDFKNDESLKTHVQNVHIKPNFDEVEVKEESLQAK